MFKIIILIVVSTICISGCNKSTKNKITSLIDFTPLLAPEPNSKNLQIATEKQSIAPDELQNFNSISYKSMNFILDYEPNKFKTHKFTKNKLIAAPVFDKNKLFVLDELANVYCLDSKSLDVLWVSKLNKSSKNIKHTNGGLSISKNKIAITYSGRDVVVLDINNGTELLRKTLDDIVKSAPLLHDNKLLVITLSNTVQVIDILLNKTLWAHESLPSVLNSGKYIAPIVYNNKAYILNTSGTIFKYDLDNGQTEWVKDINNETNGLYSFSARNVEIDPIIVGDHIYIAHSSNYLYKIALSNGNIIWKKHISDIKAAVFSGNTLFIATNAKQIAAINAYDGSILWASSIRDVKQSKNYPVTFTNPLMINNELVFITSDGFKYNIDPQTGVIINKHKIGKDSIVQIIYGNDYLILTKNTLLKAIETNK